MSRGVTSLPGSATQTVWQNKQLILRYIAQLASTTSSQGAAMVGIEDSAGHFTGTTVEAALAELAAGIGITDVVAAPATTLTIAAGVVTATQTYHTIDTEAAAASDDLDTINGLANGQFYMFKSANAGRNVVFKHGTGNILCPSGQDVTLDVTNDKVFGFSDGVSLFVLDMSLATAAGGGLAKALAATTASQGASLVGIQDAAGLYTGTTVEAALAEARTTVLAETATALTIAAGVVTATQSYHTIDTEAAAASDDLDTINGLTDGGIYFFRLADITHNVVFKSGTGNIFCPGGFDVTLDASTDCVLVLGIGAFAVVVAFKTAAFNGGGVGAALSSAANGQGAALVRLEDQGGFYTTDTVEQGLAYVGKTLGVNTIADPGTAQAIPVTKSGYVPLSIGAGAETNTLAIPTFIGQTLSIFAHEILGGSRAITSAQAVNQAGNTVLTFGQARDFIKLEGISTAAGLRWQVVANDGTTLT